MFLAFLYVLYVLSGMGTIYFIQQYNPLPHKNYRNALLSSFVFGAFIPIAVVILTLIGFLADYL